MKQCILYKHITGPTAIPCFFDRITQQGGWDPKVVARREFDVQFKNKNWIEAVEILGNFEYFSFYHLERIIDDAYPLTSDLQLKIDQVAKKHNQLDFVANRLDYNKKAAKIRKLAATSEIDKALSIIKKVRKEDRESVFMEMIHAAPQCIYDEHFYNASKTIEGVKSGMIAQILGDPRWRDLDCETGRIWGDRMSIPKPHPLETPEMDVCRSK